MGILISRQLTEEQYIKLFSNPVSGIACDFGLVTNMDNINCLQNIRYSKSMMLGALNFWFDQLQAYFMKVWYIRHPILDVSEYIIPQLRVIGKVICKIKEEFPDSFLFSHRYIQTGSFKDYSDDNQCKLLKNKYPMIKEYALHYQKTKHDPFFIIRIGGVDIEFTVFPNEHPYIPRQKISKVGMTDKGNIYILHKKKERCVNK